MSGKTEGVKILVKEILRTLPQPYDQDVILNVCLAIEIHPNWRKRYNGLGQELTDWVVNNWIGKYVKDLTGLNSGKQVSVEKNKGHIITSYTQLCQ